MKTEITKIKGDWIEVASDCRSTVGKPPLGHEPSTEFKRKILIAEHSPIRDISVKWAWHNIKSWVATHWSRHKFEKYIKSQRSDRTGIPRDKLPQDAPVDFTGDANVQALNRHHAEAFVPSVLARNATVRRGLQGSTA